MSKMKRPPLPLHHHNRGQDSLISSKYCAQFSCTNGQNNEKHFNKSSSSMRSVYMIRPPPEFNLAPPPSPLKHISLLFDQDEEDTLRGLFEFDEKCNSLRLNTNNKNTGYVNVIYGGSREEEEEESTSTRKRPSPKGSNNNKNNHMNTFMNKQPAISLSSPSLSSSSGNYSFFTPHVILFLSCFMFLMIFVLALAVFWIFKRKKTSSATGKLSKDSDIVNSDSVFIPSAATSRSSAGNYKRGGGGENNSQEQYQDLLFKSRLNNMIDASGMYNNILLGDSLSPLLINGGHATLATANYDPHQVNYLIQSLNNENILLKPMGGGGGAHLIPIHSGGTLNHARFNLLENATSESYEEEDEANVYEQITKYDTNRNPKKNYSTLEKQLRLQHHHDHLQLLNHKSSFHKPQHHHVMNNQSSSLSTSLQSSSSQTSPSAATTTTTTNTANNNNNNNSESTMITSANSNSHTTTSSSSTASTSSNCSTSILLPPATSHQPHPSLTLLHFNPATNLTNTSLAAAYGHQPTNSSHLNTLNKIALVYTPNKMPIGGAAVGNCYPTTAYFIDQQQNNYANNFLADSTATSADNTTNSPEQVYELIDDTHPKSSENNTHHHHHQQHHQPVVLLVNSDQLTHHHHQNYRTSTLHLSQRKYPKTNPNFTLSKAK